MRRAFVAGVCLLLAGALPALAQERIREERPATNGGAIRKASVLMGSKVAVQDGAALGEVVDLVINDSGCIDFLIVRHEEDYMVVPWSVTTFNVQRRSVVVNSNITRAKLRDVTFTKDRWPNFYGGAFNRNLQSVWGERALRRDYRGGPGAPGTDRRDIRPGERRDVRPEDRREVRPDNRRPDNPRPRDREPGRTPAPPSDNRSPNPPPRPPQTPQG
jgi:sporulation protein YlmC with PRC-barrel domain